MSELSIAEKMLYSTTKITALRGGVASSTGTGFFFRFAENEGAHVPAIITNKHVVDGCDSIMIKCHLANGDKPSGDHVECTIAINESSVIRHPDPAVDLCAVYFGGILSKLADTKRNFFWCRLGPDLIPADGDWQYFDAIEEVTMIGCPNGIFDQFNNLPITRKGNTASSLAKNYNGKNEFMVDMACFPGSSGSPVFVHNKDSYYDRKTNSHVLGGSRIKLVGILYAGPLITNTGAIVLAQPPSIQVAAMMHLGNVIKSTQIMVLDEIIRRLAKKPQPNLPLGQ